MLFTYQCLHPYVKKLYRIMWAGQLYTGRQKISSLRLSECSWAMQQVTHIPEACAWCHVSVSIVAASSSIPKSFVHPLIQEPCADPRMPEAASLRTPLFLAVKNNDVETLDALVERLTVNEVKALCNAPDRSGCTPLHYCRER
jgi:Ankyrin repeats (many copies)